MKRILLFSISLMITSALFALETTSYITGAYNYGNFTERADIAQTEIKANAFDLSISSYFNNNWGFYLNTGYFFPSKITTTSGGSSISITSSDWDDSMLLSLIIGATYKHNINENFEIFSTLGFHGAQNVLTATNIAMLSYSFGIAGDIGIRYCLTKNFYLTGGSLFSHDFYVNGESTIVGIGTQEVSGSYNFSSFRPYIGIGICFSESLK